MVSPVLMWVPGWGQHPQVFSALAQELESDLRWPIEVYGVPSASIQFRTIGLLPVPLSNLHRSIKRLVDRRQVRGYRPSFSARPNGCRSLEVISDGSQRLATRCFGDGRAARVHEGGKLLDCAGEARAKRSAGPTTKERHEPPML